MSSDSDRKPFLGYADDPEKEEARQFRHVKTSRGNMLPYIVVCFATSLFWAGLFYLFHPGNGAGISTNSNPHAHASAPAADAIAVHPDHLTTPSSSSSSTSYAARPDRHNVTTGAHLLTCGPDVAAAKASGCRYDVLLNNWVPGPCFDQEFIDEYLDDDSWAGYADEAMTVRLTSREMSERPSYWTSMRDHVNHCAMMWRKQFWVLYEERRALDTVIASPGHTDHCAQFLTDAHDRDWTRPTKTEMGFAGCWVKEDR